MTATVPTAYLKEIMRDARARTLELVEGLSDEQLIGPKLAIVNPMLWEIGHVAWFHENFILRRLYGRDPILGNGDELYDSIAINHDVRWDLPLHSRPATLAYMGDVLDALLGRLGDGEASQDDSYIYRFATFHEDMHDEAFTWTRQTLAYPTPRFALAESVGRPADANAGPYPGMAEIPGGTWMLGAARDAPFVFDNEKWAHAVTVAPFRIAKAAVTNAEFAAFVDDGGYTREELWGAEGWRWREGAEAGHPVYWRPDGAGDWQERRFDRWQPLAPHQPVIHVNWYEADAYCRWAGVRLPREAEWEVAALGQPEGEGFADAGHRFPWGNEPPDPARANLDGAAMGPVDVAALAQGDSPFGCRQMIGNAWEWTADTFAPYPGFAPDAYQEYSEPLFGTTKVLRGGAWITRGRYVNAKHRNYFGPDRRDVFAGFRVCAA